MSLQSSHNSGWTTRSMQHSDERFTKVNQVNHIEGRTYGVQPGTLIWTYQRPSAVALPHGQ